MMRLEVFLTNLGKYNEGYLIGKFVKLPINNEDLENVLKEIGIDGISYEEYFITDIETDMSGLSESISEYTSINDLNSLAKMFDNLNDTDTEKLNAILESERLSDITSIKKVIENLDNWDLYPDVEDEEAIGYLYADEFQSISIPDNVKPYFDYESYGRDIRLELCCCFTTYGFLVDNN